MDDADIMTPSILGNLEWDRNGRQLRDVERGEEEQVESLDAKTFRILRQIADTVTPMLRWSEDCPSSHESGKLPVLDLQTWCEKDEKGRTIMLYEFYMKPMANNVIMQANSAVSWTMKL